MADPIRFSRADGNFSCGTDFTDLTVLNFSGPGGSKASAYCCNMNVDLDGEPQGYASLSKPELRPMDNLGDAGWRTTGENAVLKKRYKDGKKALADLEQKKADLLAKAAAAASTEAKPATPPPGKPAPDPAIAALDKQIANQKRLIPESFEHLDPEDNYSASNPKHFEEIFWKWYGVVALTPTQAQNLSYLELKSPTIIIRKPKIDKTSYYEDVFGRFPVVQSQFEPGPGYFVGRLSRAANSRYPFWDQRYFLPNDADDQTAFGAISTGLNAVTGVWLNDQIFAVRLDNADSLTFPIRDSGNGNKLAECSFAAFTGLGGVYHPENEGAAKFPNTFLVLYLAFPGGRTPLSVLSKFATAPNASDFPVILSFLAKTTADAQARHSKSVGGNPLTAFQAWKRSNSTVMPQFFDVISQAIGVAGSEFVQRMSKTHHLTAGGPYLKLNP